MALNTYIPLGTKKAYFLHLLHIQSPFKKKKKNLALKQCNFLQS